MYINGNSYCDGNYIVEGSLKSNSFLDTNGNSLPIINNTDYSSKAYHLAKFNSDSTGDIGKSSLVETSVLPTTAQLGTSANFITANTVTYRFLGNIVGPSEDSLDQTLAETNDEGTTVYPSSLSGFTYIQSTRRSNDYADSLTIPKYTTKHGATTHQTPEPGLAYTRDKNGYIWKANKYEYSLGICSDTYGFITGVDKNEPQISIAVSGFVLGKVDKVYKPGTALMTGNNGVIIKATLFAKLFKPQCIVGFFDRVEKNKVWRGIEVRGRSWIRVK